MSAQKTNTPLQNLSGIDMIDCLDKHKVHTAPVHLMGRVV